MMKKGAVTTRITLLLTVLLVGYLVIGKTTPLGLNPRIMLILAMVIIIHGGLVIAKRCRLLWRQLHRAWAADTFRSPELIEVIMLSGLLAALTLGSANYLFGFQGYLEMIPGSEKMQVGRNLQLLEQGILSRPSSYEQIVSDAEFVEESRILRLKVEDRGRTTWLHLEEGKAQYHFGLRLRYLGEGYVVALMVQRGTHDYLAVPVMLRQQKGGGLYRAPLDVSEPGASGEVTIDPVTGRLSALVKRNGVTEFSGPVQSGQVTSQGEMRLQMMASSHVGRILVQHRNYRTQTLAAFGLFLAAGAARLLIGWSKWRRSRQVS